MSFAEVKNAINLIQGFIPKVNLLNVDLENQFKLADSISINTYISTLGNQPKTSTIITSHSQSSHLDETTEQSLELLPHSEPTQESSQLEAQSFPFGSGTHLIVNQSSWWESQRHIDFGQVKFIPIQLEQTVRFKGIERTAEVFKAYLQTKNQLTVVNLASREKKRIIDLSKPLEKKQLRIGRSDWQFKNYTCEQVIKFEILPNIVLSISPKVADNAIVIRRTHKLLPVEYYVLVVRSSNNI